MASSELSSSASNMVMAGAPHDKICPNSSWCIFEGIASAVNPQVRQEVRESRAFGDKRCQHVIIVP